MNNLANNHGAKTLNYHGPLNQFVPGGHTPKQKFMHQLLGGGVMAPGGAYVAPGTVANGEYTITNKASYPAIGAIVFVKGDYDADDDGGATCHAEQKLVAGLGLLLRNSATKPKGSVMIAGCKSPCANCARALGNVTRHLDGQGEKAFWLSYQQQPLNRIRDDVGLGADANDGIRKLDVTAYFP